MDEKEQYATLIATQKNESNDKAEKMKQINKKITYKLFSWVNFLSDNRTTTMTSNNIDSMSMNLD